MPSREQTTEDAIRMFESALYPSGLSAATAWLGIYQTLLWYEPINLLSFGQLPHIIDADKLRPASAAQTRKWTKPSAWQERAAKVSAYLAEQLQVSPPDLPGEFDLLMRHQDYEGMQRQNTLGIAFAGLLRHVLERFSSTRKACEVEVQAATIFPGITIPGRSSTPRIDVLVIDNGIPRAIVSAKWSVRHDRLSDITNECPVYKAAYERIYRHRSRDPLLYYVATNEYDPSRLNKMLDDTCVDGVIHVHKAAVVRVCGLDGRLEQLVDLADFLSAM